MCGIAGFLGRYSEDVARDMRTRIAHRGPDSSGLFFDAEAPHGPEELVQLPIRFICVISYKREA